jgi:hypothetical protein
MDVLRSERRHDDRRKGAPDGLRLRRWEEVNKALWLLLSLLLIAVADVYDSLTSDRPYRKAMPPHEARDSIAKGSGTDFDPRVVKAFVAAFSRGDMEVPEIVI